LARINRYDSSADLYEFIGRSLPPANEPIIKVNPLRIAKAIHDAALYVSIAGLAVIAVIAYLLIKAGRLAPSAWFYIAISLIVIFIYSVPPFRLVDKGYGEALLAIHWGLSFPPLVPSSK